MFTFASNLCGPRRDNTLKRRVGVFCHPITDSQTRMCHARMALKLSARLLSPRRCAGRSRRADSPVRREASPHLKLHHTPTREFA